MDNELQDLIAQEKNLRERLRNVRMKIRRLALTPKMPPLIHPMVIPIVPAFQLAVAQQ